MKSEKIDISNDPKNGSVKDILAGIVNQPPKNAILLDKSLLPSKGMFYPDKIYVKKLSTINIKKLATITEQNSNFVINNILKTSIWDGNGFDYTKILVADKIWLIFFLRSYTYNDIPFKVRYECKNCGTIAHYDFVLKNLSVSYYEKPLPEYFEINGDQISIEYPTINTEMAVEKIKNDPNTLLDIDPGLLDFSSYITKINGREVTLLTAYEYVSELDGMSFTKFTNIVSDYMFIATPYGKFKCSHCDEEIEIPIPFSPSFFLPKI